MCWLTGDVVTSSWVSWQTQMRWKLLLVNRYRKIAVLWLGPYAFVGAQLVSGDEPQASAVAISS